MYTVLFIAITLPFLFLLVSYWVFRQSKKSNYFDFEDENAKFFVKKHEIFRFFAMILLGLHYLLSILAVIFTLVTVYMVLDQCMNNNWKIFFLLMAAILSTLSSTIKLDQLAKTYFSAMRTIETAILQYKENQDVNIMIEGNKNAEAIIGEKFL